MDSLTSSISDFSVIKRKFDIENVRKDFPILERDVYGKPLVYFDNGATTQKPLVVIDAINKYYSLENSNVHRGVHFLSQEATDLFEKTRKTVQNFINAEFSGEIIFTKGTTDGINLVANTFAKKYLKAGDEVLISGMEHHSNIVPWQMVCEEKGAILKVIPVLENGELDLEKGLSLITEKTAFVSLIHISNTLGTINPIKLFIDKAHQNGAWILIDGAQSIHHAEIDVQALDCDFYTFSSHKIYGPTGVGVLYGKKACLDALPPYQGGGDMIKDVSFEKTTYNELPHKFEAGTPNIAGVIALKSALDYVSSLGIKSITKHENELLEYGTAQLQEIKGLKIYGTAKEKTGIISFLIEGIHPYDMGVLLDKMGIAVRTGHHCTQPLMKRFNIPGTIRASFAMYNTKTEIDTLKTAVERAAKMLL
jgi:cysteine desulfurase / selenocysteine lyase